MPQPESINREDITRLIRELGIDGSAVCLHSSMGSIGHVEGGQDTIIDAFLDVGCTLLVPTFTSSHFEVSPSLDAIPARNGWDPAEAARLPASTETVYTPDSAVIDGDMGAVPAAVVRREGRVRGDHPLNSFTALGPLAKTLIEEQAWDDVYAPLRELTKQSGFIVLAGVGLNRMTILHLAEALAGRRLSRRWATGPDGGTVMVPVGTCSEGFPNLEPYIGMLTTDAYLGESRWRAFPARETVTSAAAIIRSIPEVTRCDDPQCIRCPDAVAGGPDI